MSRALNVDRRAGLLQRRKVALRVMLGALEHEVLEEMSEPRTPRPFVLRTDVIPDVYCHDRYVTGFVDENVEPVGESVLRERQADGRHWRDGCRTTAPG